MAQWTNPLTRASGLDYVFATSAFQALALKPPTSTVPSSQLWAVGNEKTCGKPQFWDSSLEGCCPQTKSENDKTKLSGKLLAQKIPIMNQICFSMLKIQKKWNIHTVCVQLASVQGLYCSDRPVVGFHRISRISFEKPAVFLAHFKLVWVAWTEIFLLASLAGPHTFSFSIECASNLLDNLYGRCLSKA